MVQVPRSKLCSKIRIARQMRAIIGLEAEMDRKSKAGRITLLALTGLAFCAPFELAAQVPVAYVSAVSLGYSWGRSRRITRP